MSNETVTIDRRALLAALDAVERALTDGDTTAALRALSAVYRLIPADPTTPAPRSNAR
jgi:hypothetical protein